MSPRRTPKKGEPDFTLISDERLKEYKDTIQHMIFSYKGCDEEKTLVLSEVWKQLSIECAERISESVPAPIVREEESKCVHKIKLVKSIKHRK